MAAQLLCDPIIKITLLREDTLDEYAPGYVLDKLKLSKQLLEPNRLDFVIRREELTLETTDIDFELRDELLGAKVEVSLKATYLDVYDDAWKDYEVENFFYGYIQSIKVFRANSAPVRFQCVAFSPDARLKHFPSCCTFDEYTLKDCVTDVLGINAGEEQVAFKNGEYPDIEGLNMDVEPRYTLKMPYTVQYNESPYDFLVRLAKRYGEFFYYEDGEVVFGDLKENGEILLHTGVDVEQYEYDMSMNHHTGIIFAQHSRFSDADFASGMEKYAEHDTGEALWKSQIDPENKMAQSAFSISQEFFNDNYNSVYELGNTPVTDDVLSMLMPPFPSKHLLDAAERHDIIDYSIEQKDNKGRMKFAEQNNFGEVTWTNVQRNLLDAYVAADALICQGEANRADLKLGTVICLQDETKTGAEKEDWWDHDPLKVVGLTYEWDSETRESIKNTFKAIAKESTVPPYLQRDEQGFLVYGDFDTYPKCGPQHGVVIDNYDPENLGRVKVSLLWQNAYGRSVEGETYFRYSDKRQCTPWIWMTSHYMGYHHGTHVIPEVGDQVLVGFEHHNAERPYVMGSLTSKYGFPEYAGEKDNRLKAFRTRSGHTVVIQDDWDKTGSVEVFDESKSYHVTLSIDKNLIRLESKGNIELVAGKNIVLQAKNDIQLHADHDLEEFVKNDINITAENDIGATAENEYLINADKLFMACVKNKADSGLVSIEKDKVQLKVGKDKKSIVLDKMKGIQGSSDKDINLEGQNEVNLTSHNTLNVQSETTAELRGKLKTVVNSDTETVVKGKIVKIN